MTATLTAHEPQLADQLPDVTNAHMPEEQPTGGWSFKNQAIGSTFTDHVNSQLKWYNLATELFCFYAAHYVYPNARVYDFGCSNGNISRELKKVCPAKRYHMVNIDDSHQMEDNFEGDGDFLQADYRAVDLEPFDVGFFFLSLMFLPACDQKRMITKALSGLREGGVLLILERFEPLGGYSSLILQRAVHHAKIVGGVKPELAMQKDLSLVGVQRPLTLDVLEDFKVIEIFRYGDFRGFAIQK